MKFKLLILIPAVALLGSGCWDIFAVKEMRNTPIVFNTGSKNGAVPSDSALNGVLATSTPETAETPPPVKAGEIASASGNVVVTSLVPNQAFASPFVILGRARAFENVISWRVRDQGGQELAAGNAMIDASDVGRFGQYRIRAFLRRLPAGTLGKAEVFAISPRDGSEQDMVSVPVKLSAAASVIKAFFSNIQKDPESKQCDKTYSVTRRVPKTANVAEAALLELLEGPSAAEAALGSRTAIMPGTRLISISIEADVATADFSREMALAASDPCIAKAFRSQIEQTLKQFPAIKVVKIKIEGEYVKP